VKRSDLAAFFSEHRFEREPALWIAAIDASIVLAVTFGVPIDANQKVAVDGLLAALGAVAAGGVTRQLVVPVAKLPEIIAAGPTPQV
jgi:hypothetical protein